MKKTWKTSSVRVIYARVFSLQSERIPRITWDVNEHEKVYMIGTSTEARTFSNN